MDGVYKSSLVNQRHTPNALQYIRAVSHHAPKTYFSIGLVKSASLGKRVKRFSFPTKNGVHLTPLFERGRVSTPTELKTAQPEPRLPKRPASCAMLMTRRKIDRFPPHALAARRNG
jgi:hypothetical protein